MKKRVLFICKQRIDTYGISYGLINSANFVANKLSMSPSEIETKVVMVVDGNGIDREVWEYRPTHVIIEALWVAPNKIEELVNKWAKVVWVVRIHSKVPFLANEGIAFNWIGQYKRIARDRHNLVLSANSQETTDDLSKSLNMKWVCLGNIYCPEVEPQSHAFVKNKTPGILDIGCFGALRPMKNHMNQAVAAVNFANDNGYYMNFHINAGRVEQQGEQVLKNLRGFFSSVYRHRLIEHPWMDHNEFIKVVRRMDIGMQVSFSESFNIVSADFVWNDIPIVMSRDIDWSPRIFAADPSDTCNIAGKMDIAWRFRKLGINKLSKWALKRSNKVSFEQWRDFILSTGVKAV